MTTPRLLLAALCAAAVAAGLSVPAAAPASDGGYHETDYRVDIELTGTWAYHRLEHYGNGDVDEVDARLEFKAKTSIEYVLFRNGQLVTPDRWGTTTVTGAGAAWHEHRYPNPNGGGTVTNREECQTGALAGLPAEIQPAFSYTGHAGLNIRLARSVGVMMSGCDDRVEGSGMVDDAYAPLGTGVFDKNVQLPRDIIGFGEITEFLTSSDAQQSPTVCPGKDAFTTACDFNWKASVKFVRTGGASYDPAQGGTPPHVGGPQTDVQPGTGPVPPRVVDPRAEAIAKAVEQYGKEPAPPTGVDPRAEAIRNAVDQYQAYDDPRAQIISDAVDQYGREVELELGCTAGCSGTGVISVGGAAGPRAIATASAAKRKVVGRVKFTVPAGKPRKIRVTLPPKVRKALRRASGARIKVTLKARKGGPTSTRTVALRKRR